MGCFEIYIHALNEAINNNPIKILEITGKGDIVEAALSLIDYTEVRENVYLDPGEKPGDYTHGAEVRAKAVELLGKFGDRNLESIIRKKLEDIGDEDGCNQGRTVFYYTNEDLVRNATIKALVNIAERFPNSS